ncbi:FkbM family methyltransferase [Acidithiobacillus ferrooxidans F221]|uniref:FkbM family methyltransferase n=1 Tax=Acidithiobacillus ferrooxidans TaxID=920 RepID=UPI001C070552|nr:FkbM family methyltransferase [Acidithiobacillus ferrooxidans]MBU2809643.1 FkbM family methyltransferase [Acidithiobacillus ferrooxidans F221]
MTWISYAQNFEDVMLRRALRHVDRGFYIDVGAQHPRIDSVSRAFYEIGWRGVHVEPVPAYAKLLQEDRLDETVIQAALGESKGEVSFYEIPETGLSTMDAAIAEEHAQQGFSVHTIDVPLRTLASVFRQQPKGTDIHWLKIDVEGAEERVLRGWGRSKARPWVVVVESTLPLTETASHATWEPLILRRGYRMIYFDGLNRFYLSDVHPELRPHFSHGPCVFDDFALSGLASAPFCHYVQGKRSAPLLTKG